MDRGQTESGVVRIAIIFMVIFHLGAIAALFFFSWTNLIVAVVLHALAVNASIGLGYHCLLVHRGYPGESLRHCGGCCSRSAQLKDKRT
jgi:fatty-acid desaturase